MDTPTDELGENAQPGGRFYGINQADRGRVMTLAGGVPLVRDGAVVGVVGVSGGEGHQDQAVAQAAAGAF